MHISEATNFFSFSKKKRYKLWLRKPIHEVIYYRITLELHVGLACYFAVIPLSLNNYGNRPKSEINVCMLDIKREKATEK